MKSSKKASTDGNQVSAYGKKINKSPHRPLDLTRKTAN